jgi:preprotein translocase subunit SecE
MTDEREDAVKVIEAHQELVTRLERTMGRMRVLSLVTVLVAAFFVLAYAYQLLLTFTGTKIVTVDLTNTGNQITEVVVLMLALAWLYVGGRDYLFSTRIRKVVREARTSEKELEKRLPQGSTE